MTRQGIEPLLSLLRGSAHQAAIGDAEWPALLAAAREENVLPLVAARALGVPIDLTPRQRSQCLEIRHKAQFSAFIWTETLKTTLEAFHRASLPVLSLKGPCLAERLYGDVALRTYADLDLLVRQPDLPRAEELLAGLGFSAQGPADDYHRPWTRKDIALELHHHVENPLAFAFDVDAAWVRAQAAEFHGVPVLLLAPSDELLYLCLHAARHRFDRLCLLVDLSLAFRRFAPAESPSRSAPLGNVFALAWIMAARLDPELPEPPEFPLRTGERERLEHLADRLWQERMAAPAPPLDWAAQHRFFVEVEAPGWSRLARRWRHFRILLSRLIDADYAFAARFHLYRKWQVRLLRPIRLLTKGRHTPA